MTQSFFHNPSFPKTGLPETGLPETGLPEAGLPEAALTEKIRSTSTPPNETLSSDLPSETTGPTLSSHPQAIRSKHRSEESSDLNELPKTFQPIPCQEHWSQFWLDNHCFQANPQSAKPGWSMVIPPPNVTGALHMGHALVNVLQDVAARRARMLGKDVLWLPGVDHAGIATQTVVERHLQKTLGKGRTQMEREEFLKHCYAWKERHEERIYTQLKGMGCSCDWSRKRFTMDEGCSRSVGVAFERLYNKGLIYRGDYLVNWDPVTETALADDEVEYEEREGFLWTLEYLIEPLESSSSDPADAHGSQALQPEALHIATTRPETLLGDTAIAVHPSDPRYQHLIGRYALLPLIGRRLPIIGDCHVDPEFGTGVVKITPAHDPNDYQIALRHDLAMINIMSNQGLIIEGVSPKGENLTNYEGLTMIEARERIVTDLERHGHLISKTPHTHRVGLSYRSGAVIEPKLSKQWFLKLSAFKSKLRALVEDGEVELHPRGAWEASYYHWIDHLRDWCISRQLWWGHRIPIWYRKDNPEQMICYGGEGLPPQVEDAPEAWQQDSDVLDTWFSSALWPFSALGWPQSQAQKQNSPSATTTPLESSPTQGSPELMEKYFPNSLLITGHDILFFWVARMLLMSELIHGHPPFPKVFLHGLIYAKSYWRESSGGTTYVTHEERRAYDLGEAMPSDVRSKWEKMSKSKGNVLDPFEVMNEYGTDAMRLALILSLGDSRQIDLDRRKFEECRNFCNKIYNGAKFVFMNLEEHAPCRARLDAATLVKTLIPQRPCSDHEPLSSPSPLQLQTEDLWILAELAKVTEQANLYMESLLFEKATTVVYDFFWNELCSYYFELAKPTLWGKNPNPSQEATAVKQALLTIALTSSLRLLHPVAPFITEELLSHIKQLLRLNAEQESQEFLPTQALRSLYSESHLPRSATQCDLQSLVGELFSTLHSACCAHAPWPTPIMITEDMHQACMRIDSFKRIVLAIRQIRGEMKIPPSMKTPLFIACVESGRPSEKEAAMHLRQWLKAHLHLMTALVPLEEISLVDESPRGGLMSSAVAEGLTLYIPLPLQLQQSEAKRLEKQRIHLTANIEKMQLKLKNEAFIARAPRELVEQQRQQLRELIISEAHTSEQLAAVEKSIEEHAREES